MFLLKMKPIHQLFIAAVLLLCASQVFAQTPIDVTFTPASSTVAVGANVAIQMKVVNFKNVSTIQFPVVYNKDVLQLVSVTGAHAQLKLFHVDFADPDPNLALIPGKLAVSWNANPTSQPDGATIPANGVFFTLNFKVLTDCSSTVNLSGTQQPNIDVVNSTGQPVTMNYQNGAATIIAGSCSTTPPVVEAPIQGFHIIANSLYIPAGEVGCMPVTGNDFDNIVDMTYAIKWDSTILDEVGNRDSRTNRLVPSDISFGVFNNIGRLTLLWYTPTTPNTRADLSPLYEVCYQAKGNPGTNTLVTPNGLGFSNPNPTEVLQQNGPGSPNNIWKDTTGIKDTIYIQNNPPQSFAVAYIGEKDSTVQNMVGCVDVRVKNFNNATYGEFAMTYDSLQLQFDHFSLGANPLGLDTSTTSAANIENFLKFQKLDIVNQAGEEQTLRYIQYAYRKPAGLTLPDNSVAFSACFKAIGAPSADNTFIPVKISSYLDPGNVLVPIGAAKKTFGSIPIAYTSGSVFIKSASSLSAAMTVQNATCAGNNGSITLNVTNCSGTATYNWTGPGITPANKTVQNPTNLTAGNYVVTVTCTTGSTVTASATVTAPSAITLPTANPTSVTCYSGSDGAISIIANGGATPYTYAWAGPSGFTSVNSPNLTGLRASNLYKVTITDASGCTFTSGTITVTEPAPIALTATTNANAIGIKCKGGSDGAINLPDATGGTAPYTYTWSGPNGYTATGKSITGLAAGNYTVVVKDSKNCSYTLATALQITEPATALAVTGTPVVSNVKCLNANDGSINVNVAGGTGTLTFAWKNTSNNITVSTSEDATGLAAGTYALTVTDANLCTATTTAFTIAAPASPLVVDETHIDAACASSATGSINLNITGGWSNSTVVWPTPLPPQTNVTNLVPGTYVATVTDQGGCVLTKSATVGSANNISLGNYTSTNVACHGQATGGIVIFPSGGVAGTTYDVAWTGGLSGTAIGNLAGGDYVATITASGCTTVFPAIHISEPTAITIDTTVTEQTGTAHNGSIVLNSISGGTPAYTYSWTGPNGFTSNAADSITGLVTGDYILNITDANLCIFTAVINVNLNNPDPLAGTVVTSVKNACSNDGCIQLLISNTATAIPFTISWGNGASMVTADYTTQVCGLSPGIYNLTITDNVGHTTVLGTQNITQLPTAAVGNHLTMPIDEAQNGSIVLEPSPAGSPLTYLWNTGSTASALVNIDSGTYTVTVTHQISGCTAVYSYDLVRVYSAANPVFSAIVNPNCANSATGSIAFTFSGANGLGYQYNWSGPNGFTATTHDITGLSAGTYTITVTDESDSTFIYSRTITAQSQLEVTNVNETSLYNGYQVSGAGACDGKASVAFSGQSGNATIAWSNGVNTASNITLCGGAYSVTVTDQLGCSSVWSDSLSAPQGVAAQVQIITAVTCAKECDGIAEISVVGGVAPYVVRWALPGNQFQTDPLLNSSSYSIADNLCGGSYAVTVTDGNGVATLTTVQVVEPAPITAIFNQNLPSRFNSCDAETMITAQGASGVVDYAWSGSNGHSGNAARATGLCAGEVVIFTIVDDKGCSSIASDTIAYPAGGCLSGSPVITPGQQDGKNDVLYITCAETIDNTVQIFNRWGQLVFNVQNYDNNSVVWTGTTKSGATLPEGVYFYVMTYTDDQGSPQRIKGYVNLLR